MEHLTLEELIMTLLTDPKGPQSIAFNRHPGGFKVKVTSRDGEMKSAGEADADEFSEAANEFLASLLPVETLPAATPPSVAPAAPLSPLHSASGRASPAAKASVPAKATPGRSAH